MCCDGHCLDRLLACCDGLALHIACLDRLLACCDGQCLDRLLACCDGLAPLVLIDSLQVAINLHQVFVVFSVVMDLHRYSGSTPCVL